MKRIGGFGLSVVLALVWLVLPAPVQLSAACSNTSSFGMVNLNIPALPDGGEYAVWVRMQSGGSVARVQLEINGNACLDVIGNGMAPNQWSWQSYQNNGKLQTVRFARQDGNTVKLIGVESGVKVDKVMLTKPDCVPVDFGNNCTSSVELIDNQNNTSVLYPPSNEPVHGEITLTATPQLHKAQLRKLSYSVGGKTVQTSASAVPFDTTLVPNGKHTVMILTELTTGQKIQESTVIEVDNSENAFTPFVRWARVNKNSVQSVAMLTGATIALLLFVWWLRRAYIKHRERRFHGF